MLLSGAFLAGKVAELFHVRSKLNEAGEERIYHVEGHIFFASADSFIAAFNFGETLHRVTIDVSRPICGTSPPSAHFALHDKEHGAGKMQHCICEHGANEKTGRQAQGYAKCRSAA